MSDGWISGERIRSIDEQFRRLPGQQGPDGRACWLWRAVTFEDGATERSLTASFSQHHHADGAVAEHHRIGRNPDGLGCRHRRVAARPDAPDRRRGCARFDSTSTTAGIERAFGGSTIATQATSAVARIMSPLYVDTASFPSRRASGRDEEVLHRPDHVRLRPPQCVRPAPYLTQGLSDVAFEEQNHMEVALAQLEMMVWYGKAIKRN